MLAFLVKKRRGMLCSKDFGGNFTQKIRLLAFYHNISHEWLLRTQRYVTAFDIKTVLIYLFMNRYLHSKMQQGIFFWF